MKSKMIRIAQNLFVLILLLLIRSTCSAQTTASNMLVLKGEDFPTQKVTPLFCDTLSSCWSIHDGAKKTVVIQLNGFIDNKKVQLRIETPAQKGNYKLRLDPDGDQKTGENFYLEILGKNPPVDNTIYTLEDEADEATIHIDNLDEESGQLNGTFSCRLMNSSTGVKKAGISGSISLNRN